MWTGRRRGQKSDVFVDVINGWPHTCTILAHTVMKIGLPGGFLKIGPI